MTESKKKRRGVVEPTMLALVVFAILVGLGWWQLERKQWKEGLVGVLNERLAAAPESGLPPRDRWSRLDRKEYEYKRITVPVEFVPNEEALVYTAGSAFRPDVSGPGYWVFSPARLHGGSTIIVNRGFVPFDRKDAASRRDGAIKGIIDIVGVLHGPESRGLFTPADEPQNNIWYVRDPQLIAKAKNWGPVSPFFVDMEQPQPAGGLPKSGPLVVKLTNNHLQYALTWFGLAATLVGVYIAWMRARLRRR